MPVNQPTILVKKADGTSVRLTMEEFKIYKEQRTKSKEQEDKMVDLPMVVGTEALATTAPVTEAFVDDAAYKHSNIQTSEQTKPDIVVNSVKDGNTWEAEDHTSPLEEKIEMSGTASTSLPHSQEDLASFIIKKIKFPVRDEVIGRLRSLVISKLKDVRTDEQFLEQASRGENNGGLGFSAEQARTLLDIVNNAERKTEPVMVSRTEEKKPVMNLENIPVVEASKTSFTVAKPKMADILPAPVPVVEEKKSVGPIDELRNFSLADFRRLSSQPEKAMEILQNKFIVLKEDSLLLYFEGVSAWQTSPLYRQYQGIMMRSIREGKKVSDILAGVNDKNEVKYNEFEVIVRLNENLSM